MFSTGVPPECWRPVRTSALESRWRCPVAFWVPRLWRHGRRRRRLRAGKNLPSRQDKTGSRACSWRRLESLGRWSLQGVAERDPPGRRLVAAVAGGYLARRGGLRRPAAAWRQTRLGCRVCAGLQTSDADDLVPRPDSDGEGSRAARDDGEGASRRTQTRQAAARSSGSSSGSFWLEFCLGRE